MRVLAMTMSIQRLPSLASSFGTFFYHAQVSARTVHHHTNAVATLQKEPEAYSLTILGISATTLSTLHYTRDTGRFNW
jgi:hypothetical protein